ncbi:DUF3084 domain-containing protein [Leptolyngbya sp. FACHB-261]|uniref:DUF3084 domain-containing protein n=1 Tax=Leptolyngbya sp. FACHB-261 TaxID=2692806 RepID=UPI0016842EA8|nr:DUF3084 domain-containing protein [Leptolyngbya sp. FACHB-261]MBD2104652.1 DUF3084 domain-containing protein [Leptolyngbya sp. FACHB-261]
MTGYILVLVVLILGGVIATLGDRIGTRVGKARLSLFNLRPKKTAVLITIITGVLISGSTLLLLFLTDRQLRTGLFQLGQIQEQLRNARTERQQAESALKVAQDRQSKAQRRLNQTNQSLAQSLQRQQKTATQLKTAEQGLAELQRRYRQVNEQLSTVSKQEVALRQTITQLIAERQRLSQERTQLRVQLETSVSQAQDRLSALEDQRSQLELEIRSLRISQEQIRRSAQVLRQGPVGLQAGQVLATGVVNQVSNQADARQAIDQILRQANREVQQLIAGIPERDVQNDSYLAIQITEPEVTQLMNRITDGGNYVIRIQSAANYLVGETSVRVYADLDPNRVVFPAGEVVAAISVDLSQTRDQKVLLERLDFLFTASNFRARQAGVLADPLTGKVGEFSQASVIELIQELQQYTGRVDILAVTSRSTYTAGPLALELVVTRDNEVLLRIGSE